MYCMDKRHALLLVSCLCHSSCGTVSNYTLPYIQHDRPCEIGLKFSVVRGISYELLALDWHLTVYKVFSKSIISQQPFKAGRKTRVTPIWWGSESLSCLSSVKALKMSKCQSFNWNPSHVILSPIPFSLHSEPHTKLCIWMKVQCGWIRNQTHELTLLSIIL